MNSANIKLFSNKIQTASKFKRILNAYTRNMDG